MAIVFNSDAGTISGLSVGGLPDGIVDAGTLATNSVDSAELIDGAVDDSHIGALAASKLTGALPAISGASLTGITTGKVLQVKENTAHSVVASDPSSHTTLYSLTITPTSASSKILVTAVVGGLYLNYAGNQNNSNWRIARGSTVPTGANSNFQTEVGRSATATGERGYVTMQILDEPGTTSATTYNVQVIRINGSGGISIGDTAGTSTITCMEIGA